MNIHGCCARNAHSTKFLAEQIRLYGSIKALESCRNRKDRIAFELLMNYDIAQSDVLSPAFTYAV